MPSLSSQLLTSLVNTAGLSDSSISSTSSSVTLFPAVRKGGRRGKREREREGGREGQKREREGRIEKRERERWQEREKIHVKWVSRSHQEATTDYIWAVLWFCPCTSLCIPPALCCTLPLLPWTFETAWHTVQQNKQISQDISLLSSHIKINTHNHVEGVTQTQGGWQASNGTPDLYSTIRMDVCG